MNTFKTEGIILSSKMFFEKDKMITLFSPTLGKCRILAKSAHSPKSKFAGRLEVTTHVALVLYRGRTFTQVSQCDIKTGFINIRQSLEKISLSYYCLDIISKTTDFEQVNVALYELLLTTLEQIHNGTDVEAVKQWFQTHFLKVEGLLDHDYPHIISDQDFVRRFEEYTGMPTLNPLC